MRLLCWDRTGVGSIYPSVAHRGDGVTSKKIQVRIKYMEEIKIVPFILFLGNYAEGPSLNVQCYGLNVSPRSSCVRNNLI